MSKTTWNVFDYNKKKKLTENDQTSSHFEI